MSKENVKNFFEELEKNAGLKMKFIDLMKKHHEELSSDMENELLKIAADSGFPFTSLELHDIRSGIIEEVNGNIALSDEELSVAAGGGPPKWAIIVMSIGSLGLGCAIESILFEVGKKGGCGEYLTTAKKC